MIKIEKLTAQAFQPFGQVFSPPTETGGSVESLGFNCNSGNARQILALLNCPAKSLPVRVRELERHPFTSQTFIALGACKYVVIVAPAIEDKSPDITNLRAFLANKGQSINYNIGVWHYELTLLEKAGKFAVLMYSISEELDTEYFSLPQEIIIADG